MHSVHGSAPPTRLVYNYVGGALPGHEAPCSPLHIHMPLSWLAGCLIMGSSRSNSKIAVCMSLHSGCWRHSRPTGPWSKLAWH